MDVELLCNLDSNISRQKYILNVYKLKKKQLTIHRLPCEEDTLEEQSQGKLFSEVLIYFYSFILFI